MKHTTYYFTKDGKEYAAKADNRIDAQQKLEFLFGIDLQGATYTECYKLRTVRTGTVR